MTIESGNPSGDTASGVIRSRWDARDFALSFPVYLAILCSGCALGVAPQASGDVRCALKSEYAQLAEGSTWNSWTQVREITHRGYACCQPENTIEAVNAALADGAAAIEVDVRTTADGVPVLMHDETLDRTTDSTGPVSGLTYDALRRVNACPGGGSPCIVPTVAQVLSSIDGRALLVLDLKDAWTCHQFETIAGAIDATNSWHNVAFISSIEEALRMARQVSPTLPVAYYWFGQPLGDLDPEALVESLGSAEIMIRAEDVLAGREDFVRAEEGNLPVIAWTVTKPDVLRELLSIAGVKRVLSDLPIGAE